MRGGIWESWTSRKKGNFLRQDRAYADVHVHILNNPRGAALWVSLVHMAF